MLQRKYRIPKKLFPLLKKNTLQQGEFFDLRITKNPVVLPARYSCIISKKVFRKAVDRNKQKRRVYEALSDILKTSDTSGYVQIFPKQNIQKLPFKELVSELSKNLK